ncbi:hypothetical protein LX70_04012 [Defluviimonas denitrificans]|jgi:hypothetical protein|uniref:Pectate lyase-like protein n=1 Tax=Albidovulum denitrificans TaxID=404881 RepID=A0A2S8RWH3_9RHOB|nr:hypothetical protein [Defluviimonas denitrificans]PQV52906.1 hypothetical protein LX70_04012 [Defluviimonas denitrificans]
MTLDKIDPRYEYAPDVAPSDGLRSTIYDKTHGILFLTSVAQIERVKEGDYLVTMRAKSIGDLDADAPVPEPVDPPVEPTPVDPPPDPDPVPTPPVIGSTVAINETDLRDKVAKLGSGPATIGVKNGHFGAITLSGVNLGGQLTIVAENRREAKFESILLKGGSKDVQLFGLGTCPKGNATGGGTGPELQNKVYGITADASTSKIIVMDAFCQGHLDSANHAWWTEAEWRSRAQGGVMIQGADSAIIDSYAEGVRFGFNMMGDRGVMDSLRVFGASGDCFRATAHDLVCRNLLGSDLVYMNDGNHPDGLQSFLLDSNRKVVVMRNLTLKNIALFDWTVRHDNPMRFASENTNPAMRRWGRMQGLGLHQAGFSNMSIEDVYIKTPVPNGLHIGGVNGLYGRRWTVLNSDYGLSDIDSYDTRWPKINVNATGIVDVADTEAEDYAGSLAGQIVNAKGCDYTAPEPAWVAPLRQLAA